MNLVVHLMDLENLWKANVGWREQAGCEPLCRQTAPSLHHYDSSFTCSKTHRFKSYGSIIRVTLGLPSHFVSPVHGNCAILHQSTRGQERSYYSGNFFFFNRLLFPPKLCFPQ